MNSTTFSVKTKALIVILIVIICGIGAYAFTKHRTQSPTPLTTQKTAVTADPACDGTANPDADLGFGVEHIYTGNIAKDMPVQIILSCNQDKFTITGSVNQVITADDIRKAEGTTNVNLVYGPAVEGAVSVDTDYNFDGYNDLKSMDTMGNNGGEYSSYVFLYDPAKKQFIYNQELRNLASIFVNEENKTVIEGTCDIDTDDEELCMESYPVYQWSGGHLKKINSN